MKKPTIRVAKQFENRDLAGFGYVWIATNGHEEFRTLIRIFDHVRECFPTTATRAHCSNKVPRQRDGITSDEVIVVCRIRVDVISWHKVSFSISVIGVCESLDDGLGTKVDAVGEATHLAIVVVEVEPWVWFAGRILARACIKK